MLLKVCSETDERWVMSDKAKMRLSLSQSCRYTDIKHFDLGNKAFLRCHSHSHSSCPMNGQVFKIACLFSGLQWALQPHMAASLIYFSLVCWCSPIKPEIVLQAAGLHKNITAYWSNLVTWSMTLALKMASSMCFSSNLMTHLMLLTTCWTSGGRLQLECSRNLATSILVSLYILRSARECGRSWGECACRARCLRWMSTFLPSFCCFLTDVWLGLTPTTSDEMSVGSKYKTENNYQTH